MSGIRRLNYDCYICDAHGRVTSTPHLHIMVPFSHAMDPSRCRPYTEHITFRVNVDVTSPAAFRMYHLVC